MSERSDDDGHCELMAVEEQQARRSVTNLLFEDDHWPSSDDEYSEPSVYDPGVTLPLDTTQDDPLSLSPVSSEVGVVGSAFVDGILRNESNRLQRLHDEQRLATTTAEGPLTESMSQVSCGSYAPSIDDRGTREQLERTCELLRIRVSALQELLHHADVRQPIGERTLGEQWRAKAYELIVKRRCEVHELETANRVLAGELRAARRDVAYEQGVSRARGVQVTDLQARAELAETEQARIGEALRSEREQAREADSQATQWRLTALANARALQDMVSGHKQTVAHLFAQVADACGAASRRVATADARVRLVHSLWTDRQADVAQELASLRRLVAALPLESAEAQASEGAWREVDGGGDAVDAGSRIADALLQPGLVRHKDDEDVVGLLQRAVAHCRNRVVHMRQSVAQRDARVEEMQRDCVAVRAQLRAIQERFVLERAKWESSERTLREETTEKLAARDATLTELRAQQVQLQMEADGAQRERAVAIVRLEEAQRNHAEMVRHLTEKNDAARGALEKRCNENERRLVELERERDLLLATLRVRVPEASEPPPQGLTQEGKARQGARHGRSSSSGGGRSAPRRLPATDESRNANVELARESDQLARLVAEFQVMQQQQQQQHQSV